MGYPPWVAEDSTTVIIELRESEAGLPWLLAGLPFSIAGPDGAPTGRYQLTSDDANGLVLRSDAELPRVTVTWAESESAAYDLLTLAEVDASVADVDSVVDARRRFGADFPPTSISHFFVLNRSSAVLAAPDARAAVLAAVDRERAVERYASISAIETVGVVSPSAAGHRVGTGCRSLCEADPERAAGLLTGLLGADQAGGGSPRGPATSDPARPTSPI